MPNFKFNPTGTLVLQRQLALGIRKIYRKRLKNISDRLKIKQIQIEKLIKTEATIGTSAIDIVMQGLEGVSEEIKPLVFGILAQTWFKANNVTVQMERL